MSESNSYTENPFLTSATGEEISLADERKIHDFSTMSPEYFASTYGMDEYLSMHRQMTETENAVRAAAVQGNAIDNILDTSKNFAAGALSGLSSTASLVTTPIRPVSEGFARLTDMINKASESLSSESERASRELYQFKQQGLKNRLDREEREGKISNVERIAEEVAGTVGNAFSSGHYFELGTSALGSMAAGGPVAKGISLGLGAAAKLAPGIAKGINTAAQASTTAQKLKDAAPWMLSMGLQEGGGTYGDMLLKGINVPYEELMANSPEFQTLYAQYRKEKLTDAEAKEKAREDLAYMAAREAGLLTAGAATVANYLTAGLGKGIDKVSFAGTTVSPFLRHSGDSVKKAIGNALSEPVEEGITEGLGQVASNYATREYLNRNQDLYEDVGSSIAEGAVGGLGITGVNTTTSALGSLYEEGAKLNAERKAKQAVVPVSTPKAINLPAPSQSMMNLSEDPEDTRSVSQVAVDSQEELKQNQQAVNSIQNPATSIKDEETGFDSSNTALEPELQQKHNVASKPEFLNTFAKQKNENDTAEGTISLEEANKVALSTAMDLDNIAVTLQKIANKELSVTPEERKALISQANASAAALKNYFSVTDVSEVPSELEFLKTKFDVTNKPETVTEERLDRVLKSSTTLSDTEKDVITSLKGFFVQEKAIDAERKNLNELSDKTELVAKNVTWGKEQGYRNSGKFSLWQWASDVYKAKAAGNEASLKNSINEVRKLVTHFENKIKALNASAALAKSSNGDAQKVTFDMLNPKSRRFEKNKGVVHWKPTSTKSTQLARAVQFDLVRTIQAYNHLIKLAPNLGFEPITQFTRLADGKGDDINLPNIVSYEEAQAQTNKESETSSNEQEANDTLNWLPEDGEKASTENIASAKEANENTVTSKKEVTEASTPISTQTTPTKEASEETYDGIPESNNDTALEVAVEPSTSKPDESGKVEKVVEEPKEDTSKDKEEAPLDQFSVSENGFDVSDKEDKLAKKFSPYLAKLSDGRSIEEHYQVDIKGYTSIEEGRRNPSKNLTGEELKKAYLDLWREWADAHPELMGKLRDAALKNNNSLVSSFLLQADVLTTLLNEGYGLEEFKNIQAQRKKQEAIKEMAKKIKNNFKSSILSRLFKLKGAFNSRLSLLTSQNKFTLSDIISNQKLLDRFLSYDKDPERVKALITLDQNETSYWTDLLNHVDSVIIPGIEKRAKDQLIYKEAYQKAYPDTDTDSLSGFYHLKLFKDGKYPEELTRAVGLATLSTILQSQHFKDNEELADMFGVSEEDIDEFTPAQLNVAQRSMNKNMLLTDIVKKAKNYMNVSSIPELPLGSTDGVIAAIAHGALESLLKNQNSSLKLIKRKFTFYKKYANDTVVIKNGKPVVDKTVEVLVPMYKNGTERGKATYKLSLPVELTSNSYFLDNLLLTSSSGHHREFWGNAEMPIHPTLNHTNVPIKEGQAKAIENRQKVDFNINEEIYKAFTNMGEKGIIHFFSEDPEGKEHLYHNEHLESVKGKNDALLRSYAIMQHEYKVAQQISKNTGIPLDKVNRHYAYNVSRVGRYQMEGSATPQGDKLIREFMSPTKDVIDLNDDHTKGNYLRCIAQGFGVKVNNFHYEKTEDIEKALNKYTSHPDFKVIQDYFDNPSPTLDDVKNLKKAFTSTGIDKTHVGFACARDYCKYLKLEKDKEKQEAKEALAKYTTYVYLEADGVTNGTANFLMLANGNQLTPATLNASRRVGVNYGSDAGESLGQIKDTQPDAKIDTYTWVAKRSADTLNKDIFNRKLVKTPEGEVWEEYGEPIGNLRDAYKTVYSFFGDWGKKADEDFFVRNVVKNPVTTVNYGAGAASLAYKLFLDLKKKFNAKISDANIKFVERENKDITWGMLFTGAETKEEAKAKRIELNKAILIIETAAQQAAIDNNRPTLQIANEYLIPPVRSTWSEDKIIEFTKKIEFLNGKEHTFYNLADQINFFTEKNIGKTSIYSDVTENDPKNTLTFFNNLNTIAYKLQDFIFQQLHKKAEDSLTKEQKKLGLSQKQFNDILNTVGVAAYNLDSGDRIISPSKQKRITDSGYIYESVSLTEVKKNKDGKELFNLTGQIEPDILGHITYAPDVMKPSEPGVALMPDSIIGFGDASMMTILSSIMHTLDVFDGFNSRVSDIDENGLKSNQAVYESWQTNLGTINKQAWAKVMRSTFLNEEFANEFWEYLANNPVDAFTKDFFETIAKSLRNKKIEEVRFKNGVFTLSAEKYKETFDKNRLVSLFTEEAFNLLDAKEEVLARSIFARNAINSSQDQMASSEHPYFHKGTVNSETLIDDKAIGSAYNNAYTTAEIELSKVDLTPEANPLAVEIPSSALPDLATPVQEIKETATENKEKDIVEAKETSSDPEDQKPTPNTEQPKVKAKLVKKLSINRDNLRLKVRDLSEILKKGLSKKQQAIYRAIKGINATAFLKEYSIYSGSREELNVLLAQDKSPLFLEEGDKGLFNPETKTLYIVGKDPTTIMHEMIHAFVADKIYTVCEALGEDFNIKPVEGIDRNIVSSVIGLKRLADEFVQDSFDLETNPKLVEVQGIIKYHLNEGNIATAINEMVAYSLSDEVIADYLNNTYADYLVLLPDNANRIPTNPDYVETLPEKFFKYLKRTLGYVKRILFHGGKGPFNKSDDNGNFTILSELTLYTRIIHTTTINTQLSNSLKALSLDMATRIPAFKEISDIVTEAIKKKTPEGIRADRLKTRVISKLIANLQKKIPSMDQQELNACSLVLEAFLGVNKINPEVFSRIADMYHYARSKLTVEDFMKDPSNLSERAIAEEKYNALFNNGLTSSNSLLVPSFFAIALTSSEVKNILSKIKVERKKESESEFYLDRKIDEAGSYIFNKLSDILNKSNSDNVDDLLSALADSLIKTSLDEGYKPSFAKKELDKLNSKFGNFVQDKAEKVINWGINNKGTNKFVKTIKIFITAIAVPFATEDTVNRAFNDAERVLTGTINKRNAIGHLITDIFGRTEDNGEIYDLIKPTKAEVQQVRSRAKGEVPRTLKEVFSRKLEEDELKQLYFGLGRIDVSCLGLYPIVKKYFSSPSLVAKKIKDLEAKINDPRMIKEAKHLGTFLAIGVVTSTSLLRNAEAIVANLNDPQRKGSLLDVKLDKQQVDNVDKLVSLYAIQKMDGKTKGTINKLLTAEPEGMNVLIGSLRYLKEHEARKQKGNARFNALKGYLPLEGKLGNSIIVASGSREAELHKQGYIKQERYSAEPDTYYYTLDFTRSTFNEGIIQIIKEGDNGSDIASGFAQESYGRLVGKAAKNHKNYVSGSRINSEEALVPVWSAGGDLLGYERQISSAIRDKYLEPTYDITEAIGLMQGRLEEEKFARIKNTENIKKIISVWNNAPFGQRRSFINLEERLAKDPVLNEAWELIPIEYRVMLKNGFGKDNPIMVPASLVEDIIGIRSASISDIYTGVSRWSPTTQAYVRKFFQLFFGHDEGKAYRVLTKLENTLKHIMSSLRTTIVVRSLVVPFNNIISNAFDLMICGVSPVVLAKETPKILIQIEKYQQIMRQLVHIDTLLRSQQPNKVELEMKKKALTEALDSLTDIMPLIKAGEFSTVADLNTDDTGKYSMGSDYLGFLDELAKKTPKELKNVIRYGVISEDTSLYRILHKSVVYGDFVAKCLLYKHLEKQGKDHKEILALVKEHFVDYDRIAGRTRDYLERIGLLWFYNYKLRILKTALWLIRHNPLYSLMSIALPIDALIGDFDTPLTENIITKVSDLFHTIGTEMIARAPFMNPWLQIAALLK